MLYTFYYRFLVFFSSELCETWTLLLELFHRRCRSSIDLLFLDLGFSRKDVTISYQESRKIYVYVHDESFSFWYIAGDRNWQDWQPGAFFLLTVTVGHVNYRDFVTQVPKLQTAGCSWGWALCVCSEQRVQVPSHGWLLTSEPGRDF